MNPAARRKKSESGARAATRLGTGKKCLFSAVAVVLVLLLFELLLRAAGFEFDVIPRRLSFHQEKYMFGEGAHTFARDDRLFWRFVPDQEALGINPQGFRGSPFRKEKSRGTVRIECLGDSVTFGLHAPASYASMLEEILNGAQGERRFEVYNLGVPGYSSFQGLRLFREEGLAWHPDVVILLFGWNDHWLAKSVPDKEQRPPSILEKRLLHSRLYQFLFYVYDAFRKSNRGDGPPAPGAFRVALGDFEANLRALVTLARTHGMKPLLVTAPTSIRRKRDVPAFLVRDGLITEATDLPALHDAYNEAVRRVAREEGVPLADCARSLAARAKDWMMEDGIHPNAEGHRQMARVIARALSRAYPGLAVSAVPTGRRRREAPNPGKPR